MTLRRGAGSDVAREALDDQDRGTAADENLVDARQAALLDRGRKIRSALLDAAPQHVARGRQAGARQDAADAGRTVHDPPCLVLADARRKQKRAGMDQKPTAVPAAQLDLADDGILAALGVGQGMVVRQGQTFLFQQDDIDGLARHRLHMGRDGALVIEDVALLGRKAGRRSVDTARGPRRRQVENFRNSFLPRRELPCAAAYTTLARVASGRLLGALGFAAACLLTPDVARAADFELGLPVACTPGRDCWVANYVDRDPASGVKDVGCGARTYDGHDRTDFALRDLKAMEAGVEVVAAVPGRVKSVRDGMADVNVEVGGRQGVAGKECGNGVLVDHGGGWETQYCHMRRGSLSVRPGQEVSAGQKLGLVGLSGLTAFPHVHLTVRKDGVALDPFDGHRADGTCRAGGDPLWRPDLRASVTYEPVALYGAGLVGRAPTKEAARRGDLRTPSLSPTAPLVAMWIEALGVEPGDTLALRLTGPDGKTLLDNVQKVEKRQAAWFAFAGLKRPANVTWPAGTYRGEATVTRQGEPPVTRTIQAEAELR